jgi:dihydroflavonol-4-reductase
MRRMYVITGANGHLGGTIVRILAGGGHMIRGLLLPSEVAENFKNVRYYYGDVREPDSLRPLFEDTGDREIIVIHTAGIVDISDGRPEAMRDVNVNGTRNIVALCREYGVKRLVYVSSVHAIPEQEPTAVLTEVSAFSPDDVVGGYAKTKAEATQVVLDAAAQGLDAVVVHPSGILGPYDSAGNHLVQLVDDYIHGRLPACVDGGYDFVDVRDVAVGCLAAVRNGRAGECYILSNRHYEVRDVLHMVRAVCGGRRLPVLPMWMAKAAAPLLQWCAKLRKKRPLYTKYSLYTLKSNDRFSHDKATSELGYRPRDLRLTVRDTVNWLRRRKIGAPAR